MTTPSGITNAQRRLLEAIGRGPGLGIFPRSYEDVEALERAGLVRVEWHAMRSRAWPGGADDVDPATRDPYAYPAGYDTVTDAHGA